MSYPGGCLCGAVRYEIARSHINAVHCYCQMCRKAHGTAFSTHAIVRPEQIEWLERGHLVPYESSKGAYREHCATCGSHLLVHGQSGDDTLAVPVGTLDGDPPVTILSHIFTAERVSWFQISDDLPQHEGWPPGYGRAAGSA
jgi:hypothetical protein